MLDVVAGELTAQIAKRGEPLVHFVVAEAFRREAAQPQPQAGRNAERNGRGAGNSPTRRGAAQLDLGLGHGARFYHHFKGLAQNRLSSKLRRT